MILVKYVCNLNALFVYVLFEILAKLILVYFRLGRKL